MSPTAPPDPNKIGEPEDVRQSGAISVSISNYVATAALGVLAGAVVLFTYVSGTFSVEDAFYWTSGAGVLLLVASIVVGGRGSAAVAKGIGREEYNPNKKSQWYRWQAILTLLGLLLVVVSAIAGVTASRLHSDLDARMKTLEREVRILRTQGPRPQAEDNDNAGPAPSSCHLHISRKANNVWPPQNHHRRCW
jgi:hypothetical protein